MKHWPMMHSASTCCQIPYDRWKSAVVELADDVSGIDCPGCIVGAKYDAVIGYHMDHFARTCSILGIDGYDVRRSSVATCNAIEAAVKAMVEKAGGKP